MLTTMMLLRSDYHLYSDWLRRQDAETLSMYFGTATTDTYIDHVMESILVSPEKHNFLVAVDHNNWVGVCHMADMPNDGIEFGFIVDKTQRGLGVGDRLMDEAVIWCRNRGYRKLFLHCLSWNQPIRKLCSKHGLEMHNEYGDVEVDVDLPPPSLLTVSKEIGQRNMNMWTLILDKALSPLV